MKVILLKNIPRVGQKYDIKDVANGYGRNYLVPQGFAKIATKKAIENITALKKQHDEEMKIKEDLLAKNLEDLSNVEVVMQEKANDKGHLFAGIHKEEIIPALKKQTHLEIEAWHIVLQRPIKELGEYEIEVKAGDKTATFKLTVEQKPEEK